MKDNQAISALKHPTEIRKLIDHLFRHESGKMVSVLTRLFGVGNLNLAEDVVQDSLIEAINQWPYKGIPDNPSAWLFRVAKNKAINVINREEYKRLNASDVAQHFQSKWTVESASDHFFSEQEIVDDQLRLIFTCCHPTLSKDSQIALVLKTLCGFSIPEIARAFLSNDENISKRLVRARQKIREDKIPFEVPSGLELERRAQTVLESIYLLFNEGYSASVGLDLIRYEICEEAIRLAEIVVNHPAIQYKSDAYALLALMQLNKTRLKARLDVDGSILTLEHQNRSLWDYKLMEKGFANLEKSSNVELISAYHLLATISAYHCSAVNYLSTDWQSILALYDRLIQIDNTPIVLLNRAIALSKVLGPQKAIEELEKLKDSKLLDSYHLFYSAKAEFYIELSQYRKAIPFLETAIRLAPIPSEKQLLQKKLKYCSEKIV